MNAYDAHPTHLLLNRITDRVRHPDRNLSSPLYHTNFFPPQLPDIHTLYNTVVLLPILTESLTSNPYNGGSKNSLQELEKNATATPNTAMLLTTLAFSGEVKLLYALEI